MSKVITFSRQFPSYHPKVGEPTFFVEKFWNSVTKDRPHFLMSYYAICNFNEKMEESAKPLLWDFWKTTKKADEVTEAKHHTIRAGHRFKVGDKFSPRVWGNDINPKSGKSGPYHSKQIIIAPDIEVKKVWDFDKDLLSKNFILNGKEISPDYLMDVAKNDGLELADLLLWFKYPKPFEGQVICWNEKLTY